ncbi:DUF1687-domain-containing protein [Xylariomycetidae sp. FL2044]|nr:DUF1687-domain-containing protein [Xylariomycetidae sp. FL2044]
MFRMNKALDIVTLFHKSSNPASIRAATLLKQVSANATESATEDQASDHSHQTHPHRQRQEFQYQIVEDLPTADQVRTILEYVGKNKIDSVIPGTSNMDDALKKYKQNPETLKRPLIVDWMNGKATASENESVILKMLEQKE